MRCQHMILKIRFAGMNSSEIEKSPTLSVSRTSSPCGKTRRPHASPSRVVTGRGNTNWLLPSRLAPANRSPTQLVDSTNPQSGRILVTDPSSLLVFDCQGVKPQLFAYLHQLLLQTNFIAESRRPWRRPHQFTPLLSFTRCLDTLRC